MENRFLTPDDILGRRDRKTTQSRDMGLKRMLYAQADIPTYWVIDGCAASSMSMPIRWGDYSSVHTVRFGAPLAVPEATRDHARLKSAFRAR